MSPKMQAMIETPKESAYLPPDAFIPALHPPQGAIDVLSIVEAGVDFRSVLVPDYTDHYKKPTFAKPPMVSIGKGVQLDTQVGDSYCDGTMDSWCKRSESNDCLLYGHNDGRNGFLFNSYSGWIVLNLPDLKNGIIILKTETWHVEKSMWKTEGWTSENHEPRLSEEQSQRKSRQEGDVSILGLEYPGNSYNSTLQEKISNRRLKDEAPIVCGGDFGVEYAIDGKITTLNKTEIPEKIMHLQRVVRVLPLLNDADYTGGKEMEVEVAIRLVGCERQKVWKLTHVYWS
jgi:hypothetical protein